MRFCINAPLLDNVLIFLQLIVVVVQQTLRFTLVCSVVYTRSSKYLIQ